MPYPANRANCVNDEKPKWYAQTDSLDQSAYPNVAWEGGPWDTLHLPPCSYFGKDHAMPYPANRANCVNDEKPKWYA